MLSVDHIVLGCSDLDAGALWVEDRLGMPSQGGGVHPGMGTHNRLWRIGSAYLELIAINPEASAPKRPRWYGLDDPEVQKRFAQGPKLLTWVARVDNLAAASRKIPVDIGTPTTLSRGELAGHMVMPEDGALKHHGHLPLLIEWPHGMQSPAKTLPASDLSLSRLILEGEEDPALEAFFQALGRPPEIEHRISVAPPCLLAEISTPDGHIGFSS